LQTFIATTNGKHLWQTFLADTQYINEHEYVFILIEYPCQRNLSPLLESYGG